MDRRDDTHREPRASRGTCACPPCATPRSTRTLGHRLGIALRPTNPPAAQALFPSVATGQTLGNADHRGRLKAAVLDVGLEWIHRGIVDVDARHVLKQRV